MDRARTQGKYRGQEQGTGAQDKGMGQGYGTGRTGHIISNCCSCELKFLKESAIDVARRSYGGSNCDFGI